MVQFGVESENGWRPARVGPESLVWITVPGTRVSLQVMRGQPAAILGAWAADYNAFIEPLRDADSASWTPTNSVATSNHLNGTAADLNWNSHPFRVRGTFTDEQMRTLREMLEFYEDTMFWAGDWSNPVDEMHHQLSYTSYRNQRTQDFINRKIRSDGFSTFRRGNQPTSTGVEMVLATATGLARDRAREILSAVSDGLRLSECKSPRRIAMWLAQVGHESDSFRATEEYASGAAYEGRDDLGNTEPGDGVRFKGRSWIQVTGRHNYGKFSEWAWLHGLVPNSKYFVEHPRELAELKWAGVGAAWYWTVARKDINSLSDAGDVRTVTRRVNGGENGLSDRQVRYNRAIGQGDLLLKLLDSDEDDMFTDEDRELLRQVASLRRPSLSALRHLGEGAVNTAAGFAQSADGLSHAQFVALAARYGHRESIELLAEVSSAAGDYRYPDRQEDAKLARAILADIEAKHPESLKKYLEGK